MWWRSRVSRVGCTMRTAQWTTHRITELSSHSHGDRPQMAIAGAHRTCHINVGQMYEEGHYTTFPTPMSHVRIEAENA